MPELWSELDSVPVLATILTATLGNTESLKPYVNVLIVYCLKCTNSFGLHPCGCCIMRGAFRVHSAAVPWISTKKQELLQHGHKPADLNNQLGYLRSAGRS